SGDSPPVLGGSICEMRRAMRSAEVPGITEHAIDVLLCVADVLADHARTIGSGATHPKPWADLHGESCEQQSICLTASQGDTFPSPTLMTRCPSSYVSSVS